MSRVDLAIGLEPRVILDCRNQLGECVLWDDRLGRLWWTDIHACELWEWDLYGGARPQVHFLPERVGAFGLREKGGLVLGLATGFALYDPATRSLERLADVESELKTTRLNDGRVDPFGRFVCGGMDESPDQRPISGVYLLDEARNVTRIVSNVHCANSICWSPDGSLMYFTDMPTARIDAYRYGREASQIAFAAPFAPVAPPGLPDGSQTDAEGFIWNAVWGGSRLTRHAPDGTLEREIILPVTNPTCVTFGGADLDILFITTAHFGLTPAAIARDRWAGSLLALRPGVRGRREYRYLG